VERGFKGRYFFFRICFRSILFSPDFVNNFPGFAWLPYCVLCIGCFFTTKEIDLQNLLWGKICIFWKTHFVFEDNRNIIGSQIGQKFDSLIWNLLIKLWQIIKVNYPIQISSLLSFTEFVEISWWPWKTYGVLVDRLSNQRRVVFGGRGQLVEYRRSTQSLPYWWKSWIDRGSSLLHAFIVIGGVDNLYCYCFFQVKCLLILFIF